MATKWTVTVAGERIVLDRQERGEITFTVTNPGESADWAVFDVVTDEGGDAAWFSVADPQRLVRGGASVSYVMKAEVPTDAPPGSYAVQGRIYSADAAPEESSVLSPRVLLEVRAPDEPPPRRWRWWWAAVAGGVVVLLAVVVWLVWPGGGEPAPAPTSAAGEAVMPEVFGMTDREALAILSERDIRVLLWYVHDPDQANTVVNQSVEAGETVSRQVPVRIDLAVALPPPVVIGPAGVPVIADGEPGPVLEWEIGYSPAFQWQVTVFLEECRLELEFVADWPVGSAQPRCRFPEEGDELEPVYQPSLRPELDLEPSAARIGDGSIYHSGWVRWHVRALDSAGNPGPPSELRAFRIEPGQP